MFQFLMPGVASSYRAPPNSMSGGAAVGGSVVAAAAVDNLQVRKASHFPHSFKLTLSRKSIHIWPLKTASRIKVQFHYTVLKSDKFRAPNSLQFANNMLVHSEKNCFSVFFVIFLRLKLATNNFDDFLLFQKQFPCTIHAWQVPPTMIEE